MIKAMFSFLLGAGVVILGLNFLMPKTTQKVVQLGMAEVQSSLGGKGAAIRPARDDLYLIAGSPERIPFVLTPVVR
jgi:hypothetical protein